MNSLNKIFNKSLLSDLGKDVFIKNYKGLTSYEVMSGKDCIFIIDKYTSGDIQISTCREKVLLTEETLKKLLSIYKDLR